MPENAGIANNELIKQTTKQNIKQIDKKLKKDAQHSKDKVLINQVISKNDLNFDNKAMNLLDSKGMYGNKDKEPTKISGDILLKFNNQYLNKIATKHHSFQMPQMELNHMMSNTSMNRPSKFVANDTIVDNKSGQKQFISEEKAKVNRLQALQTSPDYFQNDLKASIKGTIDDYYHQKLENNMYKKILDEGMNPADQDYAVSIDGPAEQQPHLSDDYKEGLINLRTLAPATKAYINQPIGLKEKQHVEHNRDKDIKQEKYVFEHENGIPAQKIPSMNKDNFKTKLTKQLNGLQIKDIKLRHYQKAIRANQITPDNYGKFFDKNPNMGKHVHILSGNQAKKRLKKQLHKESHWMATSNINEPLSTVKTVANMEKTDKNILSQIKVNKAYTPEQISNIGNSPTSKVENLGKRAMEQNINAFLADDKYKQHEQQQRHRHNNFLNNHIQVQGIGFGSKEKDDHVAKDMKRDILASAGIKQPTSIKPSDIHHNLSRQHKVDIHKKSRQNHHNHTHKRGFHYGKSNPTIE